MRTKIGIVYDLITCKVKRVIDPGEDRFLDVHAHVDYGEGFHVETHLGKGFTEEEIIAVVQRCTGRIRVE